MRASSLARRLFITATAVSAAILLVAGILLSTLYRGSLERAFDRRLNVYLKTIVADVALTSKGALPEPTALGEPLFELPSSGWYWQIIRINGDSVETKASRSVPEGGLPILSDANVVEGLGGFREGYVDGPDGQRLRVVVPPRLPDALAVETASALRAVAAAAGVDVVWLETPLDAEFSLIRQRQADAGLGWLTASPEALPAPLDVMSLGEFEPDVWIPASHAAARHGSISLGEMVGMDVIHGPRRAEAGTYDAWRRVLRAVDPRFEFTDPPFRHSLPVALAFAATADRPAAVLTGPTVIAGTRPGPIRPPQPAGTRDMVRVSLEDHPLTATAALVWSGDLPRPLQQILFETADGVPSPAPARRAGLVPVGTLPPARHF